MFKFLLLNSSKFKHLILNHHTMKIANNLLVPENGEKVKIDLTTFVGGDN
jgi:hypothetical protein